MSVPGHDPERRADSVRPGWPLTPPEPTAGRAVDKGQRARRRAVADSGVTLVVVGALLATLALLGLWGPAWPVLARLRRIDSAWNLVVTVPMGALSFVVGLTCLLYLLRARTSRPPLVLAILGGVVAANAFVLTFFASGNAATWSASTAAGGCISAAVSVFRYAATLPDTPDTAGQTGQPPSPTTILEQARPRRRRLPGWAVAALASLVVIGTCVGTGFVGQDFADRHAPQVRGWGNYFSLGSAQAPSLRGALGGGRPVTDTSVFYAGDQPGSCLIVRYRSGDVSAADAAAYGAYLADHGFQRRTDAPTSSPGDVYSRGTLLVQFGDVGDVFRLALYDTYTSRCPYA